MQKVETFNIKLSKILNFCKNNKIDIIGNKNLDDSCLNYKQLHLNRKGNSYLAKNFWIISNVYDRKNSCQFLIAAMFLQ